MKKSSLITILLACCFFLSAQETRRLFAPSMREAWPSVVLDYVEDAYAYQLSGGEMSRSRFAGITFTSGNWQLLSLVDSSAVCSLSLLGGKLYRINWEGFASIEFPVRYDDLLGGNRSQIEDNFIAKLRHAEGMETSPVPEMDTDEWPEGEEIYRIDGEKYGMSEVSSSYYLADDGHRLLYSSAYPAESLANLFICGVEGQDAPITVSIAKHEYGVRDTVQTTVSSLSGLCEEEGCDIYWGTESLEEGRLLGSVFFSNWMLGYDHVLRVECDPSLLGTEDFSIKARMSLFIPTTNIKDLYLVEDAAPGALSMDEIRAMAETEVYDEIEEETAAEETKGVTETELTRTNTEANGDEK